MIDHCTLWPDSLWGINFSHCCLAHDLAYIDALPRLQADAALAVCVAQAGLPFTGFLMGAAVTHLGWVFYRRKKPRKN